MLPTAPIRQTIERLCSRCRGKLEDQMSSSRICYSCWLADQIPNIRKYQQRERYHRFGSFDLDTCRNATILPKTGIRFLDANIPTIWGLLLNDAELMTWRLFEESQGLDNSEYDLPTFPLS